MERIAIIDHDTHTLFVEDVPEDILNERYNGDEEAYIKDCYNLGDNWSWDYIVSAQYIPESPDPDVYDINFEELI